MILDRIFGPRLATWNDERFWSDIFSSWGAGTAAGITVSEDTAFNCATVRRAVALISGAESSMPIHVYERVSDTERRRVSNHPVEWLLNDEPNPEMDGVTFRETLTMHALAWGNGYAEIQRMGSRPAALHIIHPSNVRIDVQGDAIVYRVREDNREFSLAAGDVFHLKNLGSDGLCGWSSIRRARETIGLALATERYGSGFFGNGARPGGFLKHPGKLSEKARENLRKSIEHIHQGTENAHKIAILEEGMDWVLASTPPEDAQFLSTRKFNVVEIGRWFDVPPHLLYDMDSATDNNTEKMGLDFLVFGMMRWLLRWEKAISRLLFTMAERRKLYAEHQTGAMARADIATRFNAYATAHSNGWMSVNDIRRLENQPSIGPSGDIYLLPGNMLAAEEVLRRVETPPAPKPAPGPPPSGNGNGQPPDTPAPTPTDRMGLIEAHRQLLADTLGRLARKEAKAATAAAKKPASFLAWLDQHCRHHQRIMNEALTPILVATRAAGLEAPDPEALAADWTKRTHATLLHAAGQATAAEFPTEIAKTLESWEERVHEQVHSEL